MMRFDAMPNSLRLAIAAVGLASVFALWSVASALKVNPVESSDTGSKAPGLSAGTKNGGRSAAISDAVQRDLFSPTRTKPAQRYKLPGETQEVTQQQRRGPALRWIGVISHSSDSTKNKLYVQLGNLPARGLRKGDKMGEYTLKSYTNKSAVFLTATGDSTILTPPPFGTTPR